MATRVGYEEIKSAAARILGHCHKTSVITSATLDKMAGKKLFFKCEMMQKTGSFKARGALNGILAATEREKVAGVVTHSSGNHGQAVAWAAREAGIPAHVVVPQGTPSIKCEAIRGYGAQLTFCEASPTARKEKCDEIATRTGYLVVHPYDNYDVMAGQGTIALELLHEVPDLDAIIVPISGGGMSSGIATAAAVLRPECRVLVVEPEGKMLGQCLQQRKRLWSDPPQFLNTIAEGIKMQQVGQLTFPILCDLIKGVITVNDRDMVRGMKVAAERLKVVVEASSGASIAGALSDKVKHMADVHKVGVILCGGNLDLDHLPWLDEKFK